MEPGGIGLSSQATVTGLEDMAWSCIRGCSGWTSGGKEKDCQPLEWAAQGGGGVALPEGVQETTGHGT